jgi:hypothetical protein
MRFQGTYENEDGYAGKSRPQTFQITEDEIYLYCTQESTDDEIIAAYQQIAEEDFRNRIGIFTSKEQEFLEFARKTLKG